jgi:hypothetical protein
MKFDLHTDLANQITIENLKWHRDTLASDIHKLEHAEDVETFNKDLEALNRVLVYFCGPYSWR